VECAGHLGTKVKLDGSGSYDPDGTALTYAWTDDANNPVGATAVVYPVVTTMGAHTFTLTVTDAAGLTNAASTTVTIQDTTAPKLSVSLSPSYLTVSNHKLDQITATVTVSDVCDGSPKVQLVSITSNEPIDADDVEAVGGGPVPFGTDVRSFMLGAEHSRAGATRVYTVTYMAKDASGNTTVATAQVSVGDPSSTGKHKKHKKHNRR
jgi:PKD domain